MLLSARPAFACSPSWPVPVPNEPTKVGLDGTPPIIFDVSVDYIERSEAPSENVSAPFAFSLEEGGDEGCSISHENATRSARAVAGGLVVALAWLARRRARDHAIWR